MSFSRCTTLDFRCPRELATRECPTCKQYSACMKTAWGLLAIAMKAEVPA